MIFQGFSGTSTPLFLGLIFFNLKFISALIIEIVVISDLDGVIEEPMLRRTNSGMIALLFAETCLYITLVQELNFLTSLSFVNVIIGSNSLLAILLNRSGYLTLWLALMGYVVGMILLLYPKEGSQQKPVEQGSFILFIRTLLLPF